MATYVILSRFSPEAFRDPKEFKKLAEAVASRIKSECSGVRWKDSYATFGRFDVVDIVEANDPKQIEKAAMIIRALRTFHYRNAERNSVERIPGNTVSIPNAGSKTVPFPQTRGSLAPDLGSLRERKPCSFPFAHKHHPSIEGLLDVECTALTRHVAHRQGSTQCCRNRHYPKCQTAARERWIAARRRDTPS